MSKFKKFYKNNRIYCILMGVSIVCILLIVLAFIFYFIEQTKNDAYGNRLNGIESVTISDKHKTEIADSIKENEKISKVDIDIKGKIIYINVYLKDGTRDEAQAMAIKSLEKLTEDEKLFYDINFAFSKPDNTDDKTFPMMGYKKSDATIISWTKVNSGES